MFFVFLDIVDNCASYLNLREKIEITQDKKHLCWLLKLVPSIILKDKQVIGLYNLLSNTCLRMGVLDAEVWLVKSVPVWEDVEANLQDENGEIDVGNFKIEPF